MIEVRVAKLGQTTRTVTLPGGSTVRDVLANAGLYPIPAGHQVRLNNEPAGIDDVVGEGAIVTLVPKVRAG